MQIRDKIFQILLEQMNTQDKGDILLTNEDIFQMELELDSIEFIKWITQIEETYDIEFDDNDLFFEKFNTIDSICNYVEKRIAQKGNMKVISYTNNNLGNYMECSNEESEYLIHTVSQLTDEDLEVCDEKIIFDNIKVKYLKATEKWQNKQTRLIIKKIFEQNIFVDRSEKNKIDIKRVKGKEDLFRMGIHDLLWPAIVVFSFSEDVIVVKKFDIYFVRRFIVEDKLKEIENNYPKILTTTESINYILENKCSLARYGDGEINLCHGQRLGFQKESSELQKRLIEILKHGSNNKILVTLPEFCSKYNNASSLSDNAYNIDFSWWEYYWLYMFDKSKGFFIHKIYGNTDISRNSVFYENKINDIKKLWDKREVVFVFGNKGRFEIKEELFNNILSYSIILVPPLNAFERYQEIIAACLKQRRDKLFLLSVGPTATVLAFDLMNEGYQALDIGHLPNCYDQHLGRKSPEEIPYIRRHSTSYTDNVVSFV